MRDGVVEVLSAEFAMGWALTQEGRAAYVYATLDQQVIGFGRADLVRGDLKVDSPSKIEAPPDDLAASILGGARGSRGCEAGRAAARVRDRVRCTCAACSAA